ncbi:MAG TPA: HEAT repeat domain-containing protein [Bryobacteraceae bacterium]|nr:HEAT repeat domain-containing protein [Bryobacteraceae bacterium]
MRFLLVIIGTVIGIGTGGLAVAQAPRLAADNYGLPRIGTLDFYGLNKTPEARVRKALGAAEGDFLPSSKGDAEERLDQLPGIVESHLEAVCCDAGKMILYVGVEEKGAPHFDLRDAPENAVSLPESVMSGYRELLDALGAAIRRGSTAEDLTRGHSLMADPLAREIQEKFPGIAKDHIKELRDVVRNSQDEDQRAAAAYVIGYAPRKAEIVDDLQYALRDPDSGVRANAVQALLAVAVYAKLNPDAGIKIQPTWFIEMLNSLSWSDRDHALKALQLLTDGRDPSVLDQLSQRALGSLAEMSRWKTLAHALPAFVLLGRVAGLSEQQIQDAWTRGEREPVITAATAKKKSR